MGLMECCTRFLIQPYRHAVQYRGKPYSSIVLFNVCSFIRISAVSNNIANRDTKRRGSYGLSFVLLL